MAGWWASRLSFRLERSENAGTHFSGIWDVDMWVPASAALCALAGMTFVGVNEGGILDGVCRQRIHPRSSRPPRRRDVVRLDPQTLRAGDDGGRRAG